MVLFRVLSLNDNFKIKPKYDKKEGKCMSEEVALRAVLKEGRQLEQIGSEFHKGQQLRRTSPQVSPGGREPPAA